MTGPSSTGAPGRRATGRRKKKLVARENRQDGTHASLVEARVCRQWVVRKLQRHEGSGASQSVLRPVCFPRRLKTTTSTEPSQQHQRQHQQHQHTPPHGTIPQCTPLTNATRCPPSATRRAKPAPRSLHSADCRRTSVSAVRCHPSHVVRRPPAVRCLLARPPARRRPAVSARQYLPMTSAARVRACSHSLVLASPSLRHQSRFLFLRRQRSYGNLRSVVLSSCLCALSVEIVPLVCLRASIATLIPAWPRACAQLWLGATAAVPSFPWPSSFNVLFVSLG